MMKAYSALVAGILLLLGLLALAKKHHNEDFSIPRPHTMQDIYNSISNSIIDNIDPENIKSNLRKLTKEPHQAGTEANNKVGKIIQQLYKDAGLTNVHTTEYDALLSYPHFDVPNTVSLVDRHGRILYRTDGDSPVVFPDQQGAPNAGHRWLAYSAEGKFQGDVVYVNYGTVKDFENLKKLGVSVEGKIAMMRYGNGFRGDKVIQAQRHGAQAVILFSDPAEAAREGPERVYPQSVWMPTEGVQRGSIMKTNGDPLTPVYPAKKGAYKERTIDEAKEKLVLPSIPAVPISYTAAYHLLSRMEGRPVPVDWQGGLNVTYRVGPGFIRNEQVIVDVKSTLKNKLINNVVGYIPGSDEEDRYVILGNHYDAWVYGSIDPNSGTAILAEVARAMMAVVKSGMWKPARSIMFVAWDAEEYGLIGSTEFVQEFVQQLGQRAVIYLNMDCFAGNYSLAVSSTPSVYDVIIETAKKIKNPNPGEHRRGRRTLYDTWVRTFPSEKNPNQPNIPVPQGGSDHAPFLTFGGVPVVDFSFVNDSKSSSYPLYHSLYETPFVNEHLYDVANFSMHVAIGSYWAELARVFTDSPVIPLNVSRFAETILYEYLPELRKELSSIYSVAESIYAKDAFKLLEESAREFVKGARRFQAFERKTLEQFEKNPLDLRKIRGVNERIMGVERCFVDYRGMPHAPYNRHVLYSISETDSYASRVMAAVYDAIEEFVEAEEKTQAGRDLAQQLTVVYYSVNCAINTIKHFI